MKNARHGETCAYQRRNLCAVGKALQTGKQQLWMAMSGATKTSEYCSFVRQDRGGHHC